MSTTLSTARDAICGLLKDAIDGFAPPSGMDAPVVFWPNVGGTDGANIANPTPPLNGAHVRFELTPTDGDLVSLGEEGYRKARSTGTFAVGVYTRVGDFRGVQYSDQLCQAVKDAYTGKHRSGVWFRRVRIRGGSATRTFYFQGVFGQYQYDEHGQ